MRRSVRRASRESFGPARWRGRRGSSSSRSSRRRWTARCSRSAWRANVAEAGLEETAELIDGDAFETLPQIQDVFDLVFIDAEKDDYERLFQLARGKVEPGGLLVADNVLSHADPLAEYSSARQADPT